MVHTSWARSRWRAETHRHHWKSEKNGMIITTVFSLKCLIMCPSIRAWEKTSSSILISATSTNIRTKSRRNKHTGQPLYREGTFNYLKALEIRRRARPTKTHDPTKVTKEQQKMDQARTGAEHNIDHHLREMTMGMACHNCRRLSSLSPMLLMAASPKYNERQKEIEERK